MQNVTVAKFELAFTRCRNNLKTVGNLMVKSSLQDFDAKEMYERPNNRSFSLQKRRKMFCFHHFRVFTRCRFQNISKRIPFSKSAREECAVFLGTRSLSVIFFAVFKLFRHRVNAILEFALAGTPHSLW